MLQYVQPITLDVAGGNVYKYVYAKQGDSGSRYVCATILANGKTIDISSDLTAEFRAVKRDGRSVINPATINSDGTITVELTQQTLAVEGIVDADIIIKSSSGDVLSTASFKILVEKAPVSEQIDSANELLAIKQIIIDMINDNGGGISATAADLLMTILRSGVYTNDQSANIAALEAALSSGGDSGGSGDSGGGETTPGIGVWANGKFYFELSRGRIVTTAGYQNSDTNRASYIGLSCTLTPGNSYRLVGRDDVQYGVQTITESGYAKIQNSSDLTSGTDKLDSGWQSSGYEFVADDAAVCAWVTAHYTNNAVITPEQAMPVYLEAASSGGTTYTITNALTNASTSNSAASIAEGASYSATITADSGYTISSVTVTMGGVDVTADVYAGGVVTIPSVTGAVEIVVLTAENSTSGDAELITDGLMAFFDLRNRTAAAGNSSTGFYHEATIGQGRLYSWSATGGDGSEYGSTANGTYCSGESYNAYQFGTSFTMIVKGYSTGNLSTLGIAGWASPSNYGGIISGKYYKSDGSTASTEGTTVSKTTGYSIFSLCVNAAQCKIFRDGNLVLQLDGTDYDDFAKWYDQFGGFGNRWNNAALNVAAAFYTRALSDVEIVEMDEYLKTLEVDA